MSGGRAGGFYDQSRGGEGRVSKSRGRERWVRHSRAWGSEEEGRKGKCYNVVEVISELHAGGRNWKELAGKDEEGGG